MKHGNEGDYDGREWGRENIMNLLILLQHIHTRILKY